MLYGWGFVNKCFMGEGYKEVNKMEMDAEEIRIRIKEGAENVWKGTLSKKNNYDYVFMYTNTYTYT